MCSTITKNLHSARTFQRFTRALQVLSKLSRSHLTNSAMIITATRDLMSTASDFFHDFGALIRDPSEHEKCSLDIVSVQKIKRLDCVLFEASFEAIPLSTLDQPVKGSNVKIVF